MFYTQKGKAGWCVVRRMDKKIMAEGIQDWLRAIIIAAEYANDFKHDHK